MGSPLLKWRRKNKKTFHATVPLQLGQQFHYFHFNWQRPVVKKEGSGKVVKFDLLSLFAGRESCVKRSGHAMFHNTPVRAGIFLDILT
jgi:hypothetical protein